MYKNVHVHVYIHGYSMDVNFEKVHTDRFAYVDMYVCMHPRMCRCMGVHTRAYVYMCVYVCMYVLTCAYSYMCTCNLRVSVHVFAQEI